MNNLKDSIQKLRAMQNGEDIKQSFQVFPKIKREKKGRKFELTKGIIWKLFNDFSPDGYVIGPRNEEVIYTVLRFFLQADDFNSYGLIKNKPNLKKGLLIYGDYGVGKSQLFEIIRDMGRELATKANCNDLWFSQISAGSFVDEYMASTKDDHTNFRVENYYRGKLYIDDLGFEKKAFNKTELFGQVLFERNKRGSKTFVTTNLKPYELTEKYGERIGDRLPEMFNIINWSGESFRE